MFTMEYRINGALLGVIYGHNKGDVPAIARDAGRTVDMVAPCLYEWRYHDIESGAVYSGEVIHDRDDGLHELVRLIANKAGIQIRGAKALQRRESPNAK